MSGYETQEFDYVIVGAGSAGCVLANRLTEDGQHSVALLEFGGTDMGPFIQMPAALSYPMNMGLYDWGYQTEPESALNGRKLVCPRGKVLGGSSSINGMVYVRGHAQDFETWSDMGASGWAYADVLPYFLRMESAPLGQSGWRGTDGPLHVTRGDRSHPLHQAFVEAGRQAGYPVTADYNGQQQEGFGDMEMTVKNGQRWSAANAYLRPAQQRSNLTTLSRVLADRILFEEGRAVGVVYRNGGGEKTIRARREVILAAGAINSPKILQLSGIGDGEALNAAGIETRNHLPGVGKNLQDHLEVYMQMECTQPITLYSSLNLVSKAWIGLRWLLTKTGPGATNHFESTGFIRSAPGVPYPDIQFHFLPVAIRYDGRAPADCHGFQAHVGPMRSKSRGTVTLRGSDPDAAPVIRFNYMSHEDDWRDFRTCISLTREIFSQPAFDTLRGREITPGPDVKTDDQVDEFIREHVESAFHPCGTCRMGSPNDPVSVVDPTCRVIGVEGLRVADSSIFPQIPNGNLNGPSIMVGEKASDHILGRPMAPPPNLEPWQHPEWRTTQR